jgi:hypothetical protein
LQDGAMIESTAATTRHEPGDVDDRRRFAPSPPCLPAGIAPPSDALALSELSDDRQRSLLPVVAAAIDKIHCFRVAHGSLTHESFFVDGMTVWITGVGAVWNGPGEQGTPRECDLAWFRKECERWNGPSIQPGIGRTCRGMLAAWKEPPPARKEPTTRGRASPPRIVRRQSRRHRIPWRTIAAAFLIVSVVGGVAAWQLTPLPRYTYRTLRWGFRLLPVPVRVWIDPQGRFDPVGRRLSLEGAQNDWSRLELGLQMQRPEAMVRALTESGDDYTDLFRRIVRTNDAGFLTALSSMYMFGADWTPKSVPRLKELLGEDLPHGARRTLQYCFLRASGVDDLSTIESILQTPEHPDIVAEALFALARLGSPAPIEKLVIACSDASQNAGLRFLQTVLYYYPPDDAHRFLNAYSNSRRRKSLADAWHDVIGVVELSPERPVRKRASKIFERTLLEAIPKTLTVSGPGADADLLMTLLCLWRLQTVSPEDLMERLSEPTPQGDRIRSRLSVMLVGNGVDPPDALTLPDGWDVPDEWFAAVLAANQDYPEPFVRRVLNRSDLKEHQQESRLLALADLSAESARRKLAEDLSRNLHLYRDSWRSRNPHLISSVCTLLAAVKNQTADDALRRFLAPGPYEREFPAWDGLIVGSYIDLPRHKELLKLAATHPLPSVWTRARQALALAEANVDGFRNPDPKGPDLSPALATLVAEFESAFTEADVFVTLSKQRAGQLAEFALGLSGSPGAVAVLHARMDRRDAPPLQTYLLLANQPVPLDRRRFEDFLPVEPQYQIFDPPIMIGHVLRKDLGPLKALRAIAVGPRSSRNSPPLLHRFVAMECYGALQAVPASPGIAVDLATPAVVSEILSVIDRDASILVRHAAAAAALRCVKKEDKGLLLDFAAKRPNLPRGVADILNLAGKL